MLLPKNHPNHIFLIIISNWVQIKNRRNIVVSTVQTVNTVSYIGHVPTRLLAYGTCPIQ